MAPIPLGCEQLLGADGNANINTGLVDNNGTPTYYGYAIGQFSRFVRPGAVRVASAPSAPGGSAGVGGLQQQHQPELDGSDPACKNRGRDRPGTAVLSKGFCGRITTMG